MSSSFKHTIVRLTPEGEDYANKVRGGDPGQIPAWQAQCSGSTRDRFCGERIRWLCGWQYVTDAAGRVSTAGRKYCDAHALKFCKSHRLAIPEELGARAEQERP